MAKNTGKSNNETAGATPAKGVTMVETLEKVEGTSEYGAGDVYNAPVAKIWYETDKSAVDYDPRVERPLADTFVAGVAREGVLESITVREATCPTDPSKTLKVVNGKTRFRAALKAGRAVIKVGIVAADARKALELQVLLNQHRFEDESDLQCDNAKRLAAQGYTAQEIADLFDLPLSTAINTLKINERVPEVAASPHLSFAAKEELSRRDPETVKDALPLLESLAKAAEQSPTGKADAGLAKGKDGKPSRKSDAVVKETKDGRKVGQTSHAATKGLCDELEGKPPKAATPKAPKASTPAVADPRADAALLLSKIVRAKLIKGSAKGESVASEAHRAFAFGVLAALQFAAGVKDPLPAACITKEGRDAVAAALKSLFSDAAVESESTPAAAA